MDILNKDPKQIRISWLIRDIDRCMKDKDDIVFTGINFKPRFIKVYRHILQHDGITQVELSAKTQMKPPSVSATLVQMEDEGYIERITDTGDRRIIRIFLTDKGRKLKDPIESLLKKNEIELLERISAEDIDILCELLLRIRNNLIKGLSQ